MKGNAITELLKQSTIEEVKVIIKVRNQNGEVDMITLQDSDDIINGVILPGEKVNLVFRNAEIYSGIFDSVEDNSGQIIIYLRSRGEQGRLFVFPFDALLGYFKSERE